MLVWFLVGCGDFSSVCMLFGVRFVVKGRGL